MPSLSTADHGVSPPAVRIPRDYNAAHDLIERNLVAGRGAKIAYIDDAGQYSYAELAEQVDRCANALVAFGLHMEDRVLLCHLDSIAWPAVFLGAIKAGIVPVAVNTLLTTADYEFMLRDSRAKALVVSEALLSSFSPILGNVPALKHVIVSRGNAAARDLAVGHSLLSDLMAKASPHFETASTTADDMCFWLYSSGSTGTPKGTVHLHSHLIQTAELYARPVLGIGEDDRVFSAAKLFFAYGLGNALTFPLAVGATTVLMAERPTPEAVFKRLLETRPTVFYGVPTLYAAMLASPAMPEKAAVALRICASAGEALPADIGKRFSAHFGVEILDGIGSTEMLHIFLSNRPGEVRYGTTGKPVPGYEVRLVDEQDAPVKAGEIGELQINGPTSAAFYWNNRARSRDTFIGAWTRSGDKYTMDADGYYTYAGRTDDMLKVGGIYVSPFEVEGALMTHPAVLEAAVVGMADQDGLIKPKAWVVLKAGQSAGQALAQTLQQHVKEKLAPYKYPRWIEFIAELPKTATGKIQRFKLRA
ncbi:MAG: benzoate-CoA ligase family protein [Betaproteobacteria bacterium]|nr:benzoate-CoA ligase family protein [Betaproteobacteria bacterium]